MIPEGYPPAFGGWTPTYDGDLCKGGHPGPRSDDEDGRPRCNRCGRLLDLRPCGCGDEGHRGWDSDEEVRRGVSRSYCPTRVRWDRADVALQIHLFVGMVKLKALEERIAYYLTAREPDGTVALGPIPGLAEDLQEVASEAVRGSGLEEVAIRTKVT